MYLQTLALKPGVSIFLTILILLLSGAAIFFLFLGVRKDRARYISGKLKTGTLDKEGFDEYLKKRFASATKHTHFTVFYVEINDAKPLQDSFGLKQYQNAVATLEDRFYKLFPRGSRICRYEYDALVIFCDEDLGKKEVSDIASFALVEGHKPIGLVTRVRVELDLNMGIASFSAFNAEYEGFKQSLQLALATSKRSGLNKFTIYSSDLMGSDTEEYQYYQEIKSAIEAEEFTLYYQPIVDLQTSKPVGYETLLRWNHKTLGVLSPAKFLTIIEQSGDINWVGTWAFEKMVSTYASHRETNISNGIVFSMNLSPKQLMNPKLVDDFRRILHKYRVDPSEICLEIVEFAMFDKVPQVKDNIQHLTQSGFKMAIDDFGLEMSSLKMLENLQVDYVKLDKSFVDQSQDDFLIGGVVDTLVGFAEQKNFRIVAEGVEDDVTLEFLKERKIHCGQGYFFGKPQPPEEYNL